VVVPWGNHTHHLDLTRRINEASAAQAPPPTWLSYLCPPPLPHDPATAWPGDGGPWTHPQCFLTGIVVKEREGWLLRIKPWRWRPCLLY
jgi:hypothetical protein